MDQYVISEPEFPWVNGDYSNFKHTQRLGILSQKAMLTARFLISVFKDIVSEQEEARRKAIESEIIGGASRMTRQGEVA